MKKVQKKGILDLVMDGNKISEKETDWSEAVDSRQLQSGNWTEQASSGSVERMLFHLYCQGHFFNVTRNGNEKKLNYEMEYLIGGKTSDVANLKVVVRRLLLIREGINLAYLETDVQKSQEALTLALGVTSAVGNPELAEPVKHAILAAWAYAQKQYDGDEAQMENFIKNLYQNVLVLDSGARSATTSFVENGQGDVLIAWENEAFLSVTDDPDEFEIVNPSISVLAQPSVAVVDEVAENRSTEEASREYLNYLYSDDAQRIAAQNYYRPVNKQILNEYKDVFDLSMELKTIDDFGGWQEVQQKHFADGGVFDRIYGN